MDRTGTVGTERGQSRDSGDTAGIKPGQSGDRDSGDSRDRARTVGRERGQGQGQEQDRGPKSPSGGIPSAALGSGAPGGSQMRDGGAEIPLELQRVSRFPRFSRFSPIFPELNWDNPSRAGPKGRCAPAGLGIAFPALPGIFPGCSRVSSLSLFPLHHR